MNFGQAIALLKAGHRVARIGWNGKGMWLALTPSSTIPAEAVKPGHALSQIAAELPQSSYAIGAHIDMRAADGTLVVGWLASQTDMLAEDWQHVTSDGAWMGDYPTVGFDRFPTQGSWLGQQVDVCFDYDTSRTIGGTIIRDDAQAPGLLLIHLADGRVVRSVECQYSASRAPAEAKN
jgi:hypothetical protein